MEKLLAFALPKFTLLSLLIKKPMVLMVIVPTIAAVTTVVSYQSVWLIFWCFFGADLVTGLLASYYEGFLKKLL